MLPDRRRAVRWILQSTVPELFERLWDVRDLRGMPPIMQEISRRETVFYRYPWLRHIGLLCRYTEKAQRN